VARAVQLLQALSREGALSITEAAEQIGAHKSTAYRLLVTLAQERMVEVEPDTEKYRLGQGLFDLVTDTSSQPDLLHASIPECHFLSGQSGETVTVSVLEGSEIVVVHQTLPRRRVITTDWSNTRGWPHVTASGKVLLAFLPSGRRRQILEEPFPRLTKYTLTSFSELEPQLKQVWEDGYAVSDEELELGIRAISAPIRDSRGQVIAAVSISGPVFRIEKDTLPAIGRQVVDGADRISKLLGFE